MSRRPLLSCAFIITILVGAAVGAWAQAQDAHRLQVSHTLDPAKIFVNTAAQTPRAATVSLALSALGGEDVPLDVVLVLDRSATTDLDLLREVGEAFLGALRHDDRLALVSFAEEATVDVELTSSASALHRGLSALKNVGKTAVGDGLFAATQHLLQRGRAEALWVEVLVTDGRGNAGRDPELQAQRAADNGILLFTVGMGRNPHEALLRRLAEIGDGAFFRDFDLDLIDEVLARTERRVTAREVVVVETLSPEITYEGALVNPPTVTRRPDGGTRLEWRLETLEAGQSWQASYTVSASRTGVLAVNEVPSELSYLDARGRQQRRSLPVLQLEVQPPPPPNRLPVAEFAFEPEQPSTLDEVRFSDLSSDPDGHITSWFWDFGDGTSSSLREPTHRYAQDGTYTVTLTVTDERQGVGRTSRTIQVTTRKVRIVRTIDTFMATDATLAGETFQVTLAVQVNQVFHGLGLDENLPDGWTVTPLDNDGAQFKPEALQWVFLETLQPGERRTIRYEVTVPENAEPGIYAFSGILTSAAPRLETQIEGDGQVEVKASLPVTLVVSRWDPQGETLDLKLNDTISFEQVQVAVAWWLEGRIVPYSGGKTIDFFTIQEVIAYWLTGKPVTEPLPEAE